MFHRLQGRATRGDGRRRAGFPRGWAAFVVGLLAVALASALASGAPTEAKFETTSCAKCHVDLGGAAAAPVQALRGGDVHAALGFTCADCHGGDPSLPAGGEPDMDRAKAKAAGYRGKPRPAEIPGLCGRCHSDATFMHRFNPNLATDQVARYHTSVHGKRLAGGDEHVATCVSCHGAHGILAVKDPRAPVYPLHVPETCGRCHADAALMAAYGIPTNQLEEYRKSVHGRALYEKADLSAPVCNSCHGNHGAAPPGVESVALICGECHVTSRGFFTASKHKSSFDAAGFPECTACHGNHAIVPVTDAMVGDASDAWCTRCHSAGDAGIQTAGQIRALLDSLAAHSEAGRVAVGKAGRAGMEVSAGKLQLQDAHTALVQARDLVHTLDPARVREATATGEKAAAAALTIGHGGLRELNVRRAGLAVSLVFIAIFCVGLYLLIRRLDARAGL